jgi:phosphatidylglycerol:prolipoprotein diacylglycerol transferase
VPIFGFGVLLAIWALAVLATLASLVRRYGWRGETLSAMPMLLLVGAAIVFLPKVFPGGLPVRGYGVMLLAGITAGVGMAMYRARQGGLDHEVILSLAIWLVICGVIGARLFYVVEYWDEEFSHRGPRDMLLKILNVPAGGLVIYGGFIGAAIGFIAFARKHKLPLLAMADLVAPSLMVGLALGRIGCFLNGCCYGGQTDWPWAVTFPCESPPYNDQAARGELLGFRLDRENGAFVATRVDPGSPADIAGLKKGDQVAAIDGRSIDSLIDAKELIFQSVAAQRELQLKLGSGQTIAIAPAPLPPRSRPVHPAQLYSAIDAGLLSWLLWSYFPFRRRDGEVVALMLTIHPITRFLLEVIRTDEPSVFGTGLSISQNISIALLICAAALWWYLSRQRRAVFWPLATVGPPSRGGPKNRPSTNSAPQPASPAASTNSSHTSRPRRSPK